MTTDIVSITAKVNGNIQRVLVDDNQRVRAGQLLVALDDSTFRADVDQARADLPAARAMAHRAASSVQLTSRTGSSQIVQAPGGLGEAESAIAAAHAAAEGARAAVATTRAQEQSAGANPLTAQAGLDAAVTARRRAVDAVRSAPARVETGLMGHGLGAFDAKQAAYKALSGTVTTQAAIMSYIDIFHVMAYLSLGALLLLLLFQRVRNRNAAAAAE